MNTFADPEAFKRVKRVPGEPEGFHEIFRKVRKTYHWSPMVTGVYKGQADGVPAIVVIEMRQRPDGSAPAVESGGELDGFPIVIVRVRVTPDAP